MRVQLLLIGVLITALAVIISVGLFTANQSGQGDIVEAADGEGVPPGSSPSGKTYTVWISQSFAPPPFPPFQDCMRFGADGSFLVDGLGAGTWTTVFSSPALTITRGDATDPAIPLSPNPPKG